MPWIDFQLTWPVPVAIRYTWHVVQARGNKRRSLDQADPPAFPPIFLTLNAMVKRRLREYFTTTYSKNLHRDTGRGNLISCW